MIVIDDTHLLFIEPTEPKTLEPVMDSLTEGMKNLMKDATEMEHYRGVHTCCCGERSDSCNFKLKDGTITNSLAVHYLMWHRPEVPRLELAKLVWVMKNTELLRWNMKKEAPNFNKLFK